MSGGIVTLLSLLGFLGVVIWVYLVKRREDFDEQAGLPLEDSDEAVRAERGQDTNRENPEKRS